MLDHCNHLPYLNPEYKMHGNDNGDVDFVFWGASETQYYGDRGCRDVGFQAQFQEDFVDYSSPLRETDVSKKVRNESSPLSPDSHHYSSISPRSQLQVMAEGRKKLMEMVHSMPECGYELSLKDIVDEKRISEKAQEEMAIQRTSSDLKIEAQIITKQKTKKTKSFSKTGDVSRNGSTEKETFLIKMFIPTSLSFKIRSDNTRNDTVVPPRSSMELTDNRADKEWWVKRILFTKVGMMTTWMPCQAAGLSSAQRKAKVLNSKHASEDFRNVLFLNLKENSTCLETEKGKLTMCKVTSTHSSICINKRLKEHTHQILSYKSDGGIAFSNEKYKTDIHLLPDQ
ncbi:hypothetical protein D5086_015300 [Populus alba]|uniref:Uncharacterized protein n=1 Tax=Populus alba TaxID=43335 RepID=A0ACC4C0E9_POPAL